MKQKIINYIRAGYAGIYIISSEEARVEAEVKSIAETVGYNLYAWSVTEGLINTKDGSARETNDPLEVLPLIEELEENTLILLRDFHLFLEEQNPILIRWAKDIIRIGKTKGKCIIILGCRQVLPPELKHEIVIVDFDLPSKAELGEVLGNIAKSAGKEIPEGDVYEEILDAASGLTSTEAENAFALSIIETGEFSPESVAREKANEVKKSGILEIIEPVENLDAIGGLELLKEWLLQRKDAFGKDAHDYGLPTPKGLLIIGIPGTGKSLTAKATSNVLNKPLLRLDAGRLYGGIVGESERNLRSAISTVEAIAPCVLWIDELEKGFSGSTSPDFNCRRC